MDELPANDAGVSFREVVMLCDVTHNETNVLLDIEWLIDGVKVLDQTGENALPYSDLPAELHERDWFGKAKLDSTVSKLKYITINLKLAYFFATVKGLS